MQKGLRMMAMCTGIFAPSIEFLPYLEQFLDEVVVSNASNDIGALHSLRPPLVWALGYLTNLSTSTPQGTLRRTCCGAWTTRSRRETA